MANSAECWRKCLEGRPLLTRLQLGLAAVLVKTCTHTHAYDGLWLTENMYAVCLYRCTNIVVLPRHSTLVFQNRNQDTLFILFVPVEVRLQSETGIAAHRAAHDCEAVSVEAGRGCYPSLPPFTSLPVFSPVFRQTYSFQEKLSKELRQ